MLGNTIIFCSCFVTSQQTPYSSIKPQLNGYCYFWPSTLYTHKTTSSPFIINTVMEKRAGGGLEAATSQTCCTQLASCRGTVWLSCLLLFRGEDKAVSGKQRYPIHTNTHTQLHTLPSRSPSLFSTFKANTVALKTKHSLASPFTVLVSCPCHIHSVVTLGWNGLTS